jgi:ankyrin repeat protein
MSDPGVRFGQSPDIGLSDSDMEENSAHPKQLAVGQSIVPFPNLLARWLHFSQPMCKAEEQRQINYSLMQAAYRGDLETVKALAAAGADVEAQGPDGWTPLMCAVISGQVGVVEMLVQAGADADALTPDGWSVLMKALLWGHTEVVKVLLQYGADVNVKSPDGWTALEIAIERGDRESVQLLQAAGSEAK